MRNVRVAASEGERMETGYSAPNKRGLSVEILKMLCLRKELTYRYG